MFCSLRSQWSVLNRKNHTEHMIAEFGHMNLLYITISLWLHFWGNKSKTSLAEFFLSVPSRAIFKCFLGINHSKGSCVFCNEHMVMAVSVSLQNKELQLMIDLGNFLLPKKFRSAYNILASIRLWTRCSNV